MGQTVKNSVRFKMGIDCKIVGYKENRPVKLKDGKLKPGPVRRYLTLKFGDGTIIETVVNKKLFDHYIAQLESPINTEDLFKPLTPEQFEKITNDPILKMKMETALEKGLKEAEGIHIMNHPWPYGPR